MGLTKGLAFAEDGFDLCDLHAMAAYLLESMVNTLQKIWKLAKEKTFIYIFNVTLYGIKNIVKNTILIIQNTPIIKQLMPAVHISFNLITFYRQSFISKQNIKSSSKSYAKKILFIQIK